MSPSSNTARELVQKDEERKTHPSQCTLLHDAAHRPSPPDRPEQDLSLEMLALVALPVSQLTISCFGEISYFRHGYIHTVDRLECKSEAQMGDEA